MNLIFAKSKSSHLHVWLPAAIGTCLALWGWVVFSSVNSKTVFARESAVAHEVPSKWFLAGSDPTSYRTGVDKQVVYDGKVSAYLESAMPRPRGFGTMMQKIDAANYAGMRIRLHASVKSEDVADWAGVWMRVDEDSSILAFDNMQDRPIKGTQPWKPYDVVLDVPPGASKIAFGILLSGTGEVWMNQVEFEAVGKETKVTGIPLHKPVSKDDPVVLRLKR